MDDFHETEQCLINECRAYSAWHRMDDCYESVEHRCDFGCGFRGGYRATAEQGDHCLPLMPPRKYWKHCYGDCEGRQKIDAWYEGYAHGMLAANQDGVYTFQQIPVYGIQNYGAMNQAAHAVSLEPSREYENVPEPTPLEEFSMDLTGEPRSSAPITGHSLPLSGNIEPLKTPDIPRP